jgi:hypothetical protein
MHMTEWSAVQQCLRKYAEGVREMWTEERWGTGERLMHPESMRIHDPKESMLQAQTRVKRVVNDAIKHALTATERMRFRSWLRELLAHFNHLNKRLLPQPIKQDPRQLGLEF